MHKTVGVVIPAHNASRFIADQLTALSHQTFDRPFSTVVVLNCCSDDTLSVVENFHDRLDIRTIFANERPNAAFARNCGAKALSTEVLLFCDADDRVHPEWMEKMTKALETSSVVGGSLVKWTPEPNWLTPSRQRQSDPRIARDRFGTPYPFSGSLGVHRSAFDQIGGFNESFSGSCEDVAFGIEATRNGFDIEFVADAHCDYRSRDSVRQTLIRRYRWGRGAYMIDATYYPEADISRRREIAKTFLYACRVFKSTSRQQFADALLHLAYQSGRTRLALRKRLSLR